MKLLELQEHAKSNGFDSLEFEFVNLLGETVKGKWLDAYFGFFRLDGMEENEMISVTSFLDLIGDIFNFTPYGAQ